MSRPDGGLRVVLGAMLGAVPGHGGATWAVLQYAVGLRRLGHEVLVVESVPRHALLPSGSPVAGSANAAYVGAAMAGTSLAEDWALLFDGTLDTAGRSGHAVLEFASHADLVVNLAGALRHDEVLERVPVRLYVDLDPGFTQVWHQGYGVDVGLDRHTHFATYGRGLADGASPAPSCGRQWVATVPPVVLEHWTAPAAPGASRAWTTVANWRSYGTVEHDGVHYGQKAHSWRRLLPLPGMVDEPFEVALAIAPGDGQDRRALEAAGWHLVDPASVAATPDAYRRFVQGSKAELAVAKRGYVEAATGWFSDRSACYLAAGRPVVAQDTGFSSYLPVGDGLLAFDELDQACDAVDRVRLDYDRHRRAAVALARDHFDSDRVLPALLDQVGAAA